MPRRPLGSSALARSAAFAAAAVAAVTALAALAAAGHPAPAGAPAGAGRPAPAGAPSGAAAAPGPSTVAAERPALPVPTTAPAPPASPPTTAAPAPAPRPAPAPAPPAPVPDRAPGWEARVGAQALALVRYPWQDLGFPVSFLPARRGTLGITFMIERRIEIYVRPGRSVQAVARDLAHEIGHAIDAVHGNKARRARWMELRGIDPATPWFGCDGCTDFATPAGDFAEVFGWWALGPGEFGSRMAPAPSADQLAALVPLFLA